jgi:hypothetical protein
MRRLSHVVLSSASHRDIEYTSYHRTLDAIARPDNENGLNYYLELSRT